MAVISNNDIAKTIYALTKDKSGAELASTLEGVTKFLNRKRLLSKSKAIFSSLNKIINKEEGVLEVKVSSAEKLYDDTKKTLRQTLKERYGAQEINFTEVIDESLIGGVRVEANDEVIDLTVKNKIKKLKEHLTR